MNFPVTPTIFPDNIFQWEWYDRDFFHSPDGIQEFPTHHCKKTWIVSVPYITGKRNAIDIGCRDGEYARYLHKDFTHVYCFDYRYRKLFSRNVDLSKVTHFKCALGDEHTLIKASGGGSITSQKVPDDKKFDEQLYTLDEFKLSDIDYIKIDVDGFEERVLKGAVNTINKYEPLLVIEQENGDERAIEFCIKNFNYKVEAWDATHRNVIMRKQK